MDTTAAPTRRSERPAHPRARIRWPAALLLAAAAVPAAEGADPLEALRRTPIDDATITLLERRESPVEEFPNAAPVQGLPPRTVVRLALHPAKGSNIVVEVWLPDAARWNGKLLGLGNGGAAGGIPVRGLADACRGGWAAVTTDLGTAPAPLSGVGNREVWKDFGHRATHLMTVAAKRLIRSNYGRDPQFSYFNGGSTGGQQAMQEAQRHPEDYDGIVARVPAHCRAPLHAYFLWNHQILARCPFTSAQMKAVVEAGNAHAAPHEPPATAGRLVSDPRLTAADIDAVIADARRREPTLDDAHAAALRLLLDGPRQAATGERIFNGVPLGVPFDNVAGHLYLFQWVFGKDQDLKRIDWNRDIERYLAELGPDLNAEDDDLARFRDHGGRLLMVSGSADGIVPYHATLDLYERAAARCGSLEALQAFCRFFLVPGMGHGAEGPGVNSLPDLLGLVVAWREKGTAPASLHARRVVGGKEEFSIDVPAYPGTGPRGGVEPVSPRFRNPAGAASP